MALPLLALGGLGAILSRVLLMVALSKGAVIVARILGVLGLSILTNEHVVEPMLDMISGNAGGVPADLRIWLSAFGVDRVISIVVSAYSILGVKRAFFGKAA